MRVIILFATIAILINIIQVNAQTWNIGYPDTTKVTATLNGDTLIIKGTGNMKNYPRHKTWHDKIKVVYIGNGVTNIGQSAFDNCRQLRSISISESVISIGEFAFQNCYNLKNVVIPNAVTEIKRNAFNGCQSLKHVVIPNNVIRIGEYAFYECINLDTLLLGKSLTQIGDNAFRACHKLSSITIPKRTTRIGDVVFRECYNLATIEVEDGNAKYSSVDGVLFNKNRDTLIAYPNRKEGEYVIPQSVSVIGNSAFACSKINSVSIPNTVKVIEGDAFRYCDNLKSVNIPNSVSQVGVLSFADCKSLVEIRLGSGIADINMYILSQSENLLNIHVDKNNLRFSSSNGFLYNKTQDTLLLYATGKKGEFIVPENVKCIKKGAFQDCPGLTEITISKGVTCIENLAFQYNRNLTRVINMSMTPQPISDEAFFYVKLETLNLFVPEHAIDIYKNTKVWKDFGQIKAIKK